MNRSSIAPETRIAAVALALILVVVSMPTLTAWVVEETHCCITMDICHPAQGVDVVHGPLLALAPTPFSKLSTARDAMLAIDDGYHRFYDRLCEAPDSPPPEVQA